MRIGIDLGRNEDRGHRARRRAGGSPRATGGRRRGTTTTAPSRRSRELVAALERDAGAARAPSASACPGIISPATGLVKNANSVWLIGRPLQQDLERALGRPVRLANDANCFALSEASDGAGAGRRVVFGVIIGTGTGGGVVVHGRVLTGPNAVAGEWGHNPLPWPTDDERDGGRRATAGGRGASRRFCRAPAWRATTSAPRASGSPSEADGGAAPRRATPPREATLRRYESRMAPRAGQHHQRARPRRHRAGRRPVEADARSTRTCPRCGARGCSRIAWIRAWCRRAHGDASGVRGAAWLWERRRAA